MRLLQGNPVLEVLLQVATPIWMRRVAHYSEEDRRARADAAGDIVGSYGDVLLYDRRTKGTGRLRDVVGIQVEMHKSGDTDSIEPAPSTAEVFNALAEACAIATSPLDYLDKA